MELHINSSYKIPTGYLIPRSHMKEGRGEGYCIVQILTGGATHYTSRHATMSTKELRKTLGISAKERLNIV